MSDLRRSLSRADVTAVTINAVIGAGIFGLPARAFALTGDYSLLAFLLCAVFSALIILCFAEVGSRFTGTGGPYLYTREAFGPTAGFAAGWLMWVARVAAFAANSNLLADYGSYFISGLNTGASRALFLSCVTLVLITVNYIGVRHAARLNNLFTAGKLIPIAVLIAVGLWRIDWSHFTFGTPPAYSPFSASVLLMVYAFTGFEMAVVPAGEIKDPRRDIPVALLTAIAVITTVYILIQLVCIGTLPGLATSARPVADAAARILGPGGTAFITAGVVISITGNLHVTLLSASRIPWAMGQRSELPPILCRTHARFGTPHVSILASGVVALGLALSGTFVYAVTVSTLARLSIYIATAAALIALRRSSAAPPALVQLPGRWLLPASAILLALWLLSNSNGTEALDTLIAASLGLALFYTTKRIA